MAHHKSAIKRIKKSEQQREVNRAYRSRMRRAIKKALQATDKEQAAVAVREAYAVVDKLVIKGVIPKNQAANKKSRLMRHLNAMN